MNLSSDWLYVNPNQAGPFPLELTPEAAFLSCLITGLDYPTGENGFESIDAEIKEEYFNSPEALSIWRVLSQMRSDDLKFDLVLFTELMQKEQGAKADKEQAIVAKWCVELLAGDISFSVQNQRHHLRNFLADYLRRELRRVLGKNEPDAWVKAGLLREKLDQLQALDITKTQDLHDGKAIAMAWGDLLDWRFKNSENLDVIKFGMEQHDNQIPINRGHLVVIGGRSGHGKTSYALNIMKNLLLAGRKIVFFSLEMTKEEVHQNLVSIVGGVNYRDMDRPDVSITDESWDNIAEANKQLATFGGNLCVVDRGRLSVEDVENLARQAKNKMQGIDAIFVDHMHIMQQPGNATIREKMIEITMGLKVMAKDIDCPVFALAQMNRDIVKRQDKTPNVADLKESGSIEQDADTILFTYRPTDENEQGGSYIICRKNRHGDTCDFKIHVSVNPRNRTFTEIRPAY